MQPIYSAKRTPQGHFLGALDKRSAVELAVAADRPRSRTKRVSRVAWRG